MKLIDKNIMQELNFYFFLTSRAEKQERIEGEKGAVDEMCVPLRRCATVTDTSEQHMQSTANSMKKMFRRKYSPLSLKYEFKSWNEHLKRTFHRILDAMRNELNGLSIISRWICLL